MIVTRALQSNAFFAANMVNFINIFLTFRAIFFYKMNFNNDYLVVFLFQNHKFVIMNAELSLMEILSQVQKLNKVEQTTLLKKISAMVKKNETTTPPIKLTQLAGLGASTWKNVDIDKYVDDERQW